MARLEALLARGGQPDVEARVEAEEVDEDLACSSLAPLAHDLGREPTLQVVERPHGVPDSPHGRRVGLETCRWALTAYDPDTLGRFHVVHGSVGALKRPHSRQYSGAGKGLIAVCTDT